MKKSCLRKLSTKMLIRFKQARRVSERKVLKLTRISLKLLQFPLLSADGFMKNLATMNFLILMRRQLSGKLWFLRNNVSSVKRLRNS
jgi:hypothetical protein